jgi:Flp pilus assembly protein protease CpaA
MSFLGCLVMGMPFVMLFVFGGGGAGDAKLMGALGTWLGVADGVAALVTILVAGALWGLAVAAGKRQFRAVAGRVLGMTHMVAAVLITKSSPTEALSNIPEEKMLAMTYGLPIFVGVCIAALGAML